MYIYMYIYLFIHILNISAHPKFELQPKDKQITNKIHFNVLRFISFTILPPTCFGRYSDHLQGDVIITTLQLWLTVPT
jgi:hypothetical protein